MSKSYRVRTKVGVDTSLKVLIEQEFEHLEILSLKILQSDIYTRQCSDYGVIVGRVSVNNGFGIPNAKISIFIPIDSEDQKNPIISELYPYKSLLDNNSDGYRYNLLPYVKSYSAHVPTGTFFTRNDILTEPTLIEVYDKYYKYNAVTNESGDYMIFGVPVGSHTIVMDVDLSDIGEFSLSPQDLIRMGIATESQVSGTSFKSSHNLRELPQIVNLSKSIEVEPLWGQPEICNLGITRTDFDLSSEANIDIRPTSIFMGSIISAPNSSSVTTGCRPPSTSGHLCNLTVGPGDILAIRQTIKQDSSGRPILENFSLEGGGKVIDENGTWLIDVPMNLDYYTTNEFGEQVLSNDPEVGIPTKGKYRFKVKWSQSPSLSEPTKRGYFLVPNIKEYNGNNTQQSYAFSVDWNDYAHTGSTSDNILAQNIIQEAINCEDKFYLMQYNKVYTVSQFIDGMTSGSGIERYIGIKNILDETCSGINNRFPTNDGNFRFDILYIIFMFFSIILTPVFFALILLLHILYFVIWLLREFLIYTFIGWAAYQAGNAIVLAATSYPALGLIAGYIALSIFYIGLGIFFYWFKKQLDKIDLSGIKVPILTYPDCELCSCSPDSPTSSDGTDDGSGAAALAATNQAKPCPSIKSDNTVTSITLSPGIVPLFNISSYSIPSINPDNPNGFLPERVTIYGQEFGGLQYDNQYASVNIGAPYLALAQDSNPDLSRFIYTTSLPLPDRINLFNVKAKYFNSSTFNPGGGVNRISVNFNPQQSDFHTDNTIVIICDKASIQNLTGGTIVAFQNPTISNDVNLTGGVTNVYGNNAITGVTTTGLTNISVTYANPDGSGDLSQSYQVNITATTTNTYHKFPTDVEYFQVITGMTYSQFSGQCVNDIGYDSLNNRYLNNTTIFGQEIGVNLGFDNLTYIADYIPSTTYKPMDYVKDHNEVCVLILNRGVDPYTPKVPIQYGLGRLFGYSNENDKKVSGYYHMNIPIQGSYKNVSHLSANLNDSNVYTDSYSNQKLYFNSFSYKPELTTTFGPISAYTGGTLYVYTGPINSGYSGFNSNLISYYSSMDNNSFGSFTPNCGGSGVGNVHGIIDDSVALQDFSHGLKVSSFNRFSWRILQNYSNYYQVYINSLKSSDVYTSNTGYNQGYFPNEIIEGGPIMYTNLELHHNNLYWEYSPNEPTTFYNTTSQPFNVTSTYYTPMYNTTGNTIQFSSGLNGNQIVMRGDRLPTSTTVQEYCCNGMVLQKNNNFQIYLVPENGIIGINKSQSSTGSAGSGDLAAVHNDLVGSTGIIKVFDSFTCNGSVNLECYDCKRAPGTYNGTINIKGHSCQEFNGKTIFEYGCYKFVTTIFISLLEDWKLMFEWIARNMVMLGACRNVFSHRFINNWVNGSLYAFPFKNEIIGYTSPTSATPNQPIPSYCDRTVIYHYQTKNFYYRSSQFDSTSNEFQKRGEDFGFPTTIMDLGPRADYIQELVMSDEYDGYIANRLDTSSYGTVDDILNLFIVSRFMNQTFLKTLLGSLNILAYFSNSRPDRGVKGTKLQIDADYAQLISINSELGVAPFLPGNYPDDPDPTKQNSIFFDCDNVLGIFFSSDTQLRDYITPKRTIINPSGTTTSVCTFSNFPVYSQRVPLSQWRIESNVGSSTDSIFGHQYNNWDFSVSGGTTIFSHKYQSLDRLLSESRYFRSNGSQVQYDKGYIYAVDNGSLNPPSPPVLPHISADPFFWNQNSADIQLVTVGAPFHFYFGLRRGASAFDRFRTKWINTSNIVN
jgi:hypothetical protein